MHHPTPWNRTLCLSFLSLHRFSPGLNKSRHWTVTDVHQIPHLHSSCGLLFPLPSLSPGFTNVCGPAAAYLWKGRGIILAPQPRAFRLHYWEKWSNGGFQCWLCCDVWIKLRHKYQERVKIQFLHLRQSDTGFTHTFVHTILLTFITINDRRSTRRAQGQLIRG